MKAKSLIGLLVALVACTLFSGSIVQGFDRFFSFRSVDTETGDVYRVQRRAEAYCDGTIVVHERSRLLHDACDDAGSCDRGWNYSEPRTYSRDSGSCDHYRSRRPIYR